MRVHISHIENLALGMQEYQADFDEHREDQKFEILQKPVLDQYFEVLPRRGDSIILGDKFWFVINAQHNINLDIPVINLWVDDSPPNEQDESNWNTLITHLRKP
jgi:hypothetical protein